MMQCLPVNLDMQCEVCNGTEYSEHESGFYVCCTCGTITQIRHGMDIDYADVNKGLLVLRKKVVDADNEADIDKNTEMGGCDTLMNTCANSEWGDSTTTYRSISKKSNQPVKSKKDIFYDHQKLFVNLFRSVAFYQWQQFGKEDNFEASDYYQTISNLAKATWKEFIKEEYSAQMKQVRPKPKQTRSRRNTEDEHGQGNKFGSYHHNNYNHNSTRPKKRSIREQLKTRKVKNYNIENIDEYKDKKLKKQDKMNLFIEEFDQVKSYILSQSNILYKEGIDPSEALSFRNIIIISKALGLTLKPNSSFEEIIHQIFTHCGLNLMSVFKESHFDESKSRFTPDYFLMMMYSIFNNPKIITHSFGESKVKPSLLLVGDLTHLYRSFKLNNLYNSEIKFLKYLNKEKLLKLLHGEIERNRNLSSKNYRRVINFICENILTLPQFFTNFCSRIYSLVEKVITKKISHIYNLENFVLGIVFYAIKVFYGLNDLPYLTALFQYYQKNNDEKIDNEASASIHLFMEHSYKDSLFNYYKQMPCITKFIDTIKQRISKNERNCNLSDSYDLKRSYDMEYKTNFIEYNEKIFTNLENSFTTSNIFAMEKKIDQLCGGNNSTRKTFNMSVKMSEKFMLKKRKTFGPQIKNSNTFLKEEIEFYKKLEKKKKMTNCEIPLPCDTYLRYDKKAMKFEGVTPPLSELILLYYLCKLFRVDYKVVKKCFKIIEKSIEEKISTK